MNLQPDEILNHRYQILRVLSDKGGMGVIYQAHDQNLNGTVVIKQSRFTEPELQRQYPGWPPEQVRSQAAFLRKAFEREAKLLFGLRHNALPRVLDYFATPDGHQFFVMEFIPGKDFGDLLHERLAQGQGPFPLAQVLGWAEQMLDVLEYLHTQFDPPIIHRDIKPQNLKLMPNGQVILLDFGLAKGARPGMSVAESILGGTPQYAPLEQIDREENAQQESDPCSDIYSLALTLHHLLSGREPVKAVTRVTALAMNKPDPLRPLRELLPTVPEPLSVALERATALFAKDRPATVAGFRLLLQQAVAATLPAVNSPSVPSTVIVTLPSKPTIVQPSLVELQSFSQDLGHGIKLEMVAIPGGTFQMGSNADVDQKPIHRVTLSSFFIGRYPVTRLQWLMVMWNSWSRHEDDDLPAGNVSWYNATDFCGKLSKLAGKHYRLPTEAEWEYACRAGSTGQYCFGDDQALLNEFAWYGENSGRATHPVGQKKPNAWCIYDMHGNVWEWCQDWHSVEYYRLSSENDPPGPNTGEYRIMRGGGSCNEAWECRSAYRLNYTPIYSGAYVGFRVVCVASIS